MTAIRADMVTVFVLRRIPGVEFLQLRRAKEPFGGTWQPVTGGLDAGESAVACALRELMEEAGLAHDDPALLRLWQLDQVHPFYLARHDAVMLAPAFAAEVDAAWEPALNHENSAWRWVPADQAESGFMWPGQVASCREITDQLLRPGSLCEPALRLDPRAIVGARPPARP
jgi:dihydroneopterin triphosphate diphosphatase